MTQDDADKMRDYVSQLTELIDNPPTVTSSGLERLIGDVQPVLQRAVTLLSDGLPERPPDQPAAHPKLRAFRLAYIEHLDALQETSELYSALEPEQRLMADRWLMSLQDARGIDPYAKVPTVEEVMARIRGKADG